MANSQKSTHRSFISIPGSQRRVVSGSCRRPFTSVTTPGNPKHHALRVIPGISIRRVGKSDVSVVDGEMFLKVSRRPEPFSALIARPLQLRVVLN